METTIETENLHISLLFVLLVNMATTLPEPTEQHFYLIISNWNMIIKTTINIPQTYKSVVYLSL